MDRVRIAGERRVELVDAGAEHGGAVHVDRRARLRRDCGERHRIADELAIRAEEAGRKGQRVTLFYPITS